MKVLILAASVALMAVASAQAQPINGAPSVLTVPTTPTSNPSVPPQVPSVKRHDPVICKHQEEIGTRLGGKSVCMTRSQWEQQSYDAQRMTSNFQSQPK